MRDLTVGNEGKQVLLFTIPMIIGTVFQQSYHIINSIIVGQFIGDSALAAIGASFPIIFLLISLVVGISNGATIIIAQYFGAKEYEAINKAIDTLNIFTFVSSIIIAIVGIIFSREIFGVMNLPPSVLPHAEQYLKIYLAGLPGLFGFYAASAVLRGFGDSKTPLYFQLIAAVVNIILDLFFIIVCKWGLSSVAVATIVAQGGTFLYAIFYLKHRNSMIRYRLFNVRWHKDLFLQFVKIGLPSGLQQSFVALGMMALIWLVDEFGTQTLAAYSVASRIDMFATIPAMTFSYGLSTFVGQNIGANKYDRARNGFRSTLIITSIMSLIFSVIIVIFSKQFMSAFSSDIVVIETGSEYLRIVSSFYIPFSILFVTNGILRGAGDTLMPMFNTIFALWIVRIPASYFLSLHYGAKGIWWGIPLGWVTGMILAWVWYMTGNWKKRKLVSTI